MSSMTAPTRTSRRSWRRPWRSSWLGSKAQPSALLAEEDTGPARLRALAGARRAAKDVWAPSPLRAERSNPGSPCPAMSRRPGLLRSARKDGLYCAARVRGLFRHPALPSPIDGPQAKLFGVPTRKRTAPGGAVLSSERECGGRSDRAGLVHRPDLFRRVAQIRQHLVGMLAEQRRGLHLDLQVGELDRASDGQVLAELRVRHLDHGAALAQGLVLGDLLHRQHRRAGGVVGAQDVHRLELGLVG